MRRSKPKPVRELMLQKRRGWNHRPDIILTREHAYGYGCKHFRGDGFLIGGNDFSKLVMRHQQNTPINMRYFRCPNCKRGEISLTSYDNIGISITKFSFGCSDCDSGDYVDLEKNDAYTRYANHPGLAVIIWVIENVEYCCEHPYGIEELGWCPNCGAILADSKCI